MRTAIMTLVLAMLGQAVWALDEVTPQTPYYLTGEFQSYERDSGVLANSDNVPKAVYEHTVQVDNAAWLRIYLGEVQLAPGSFVRFTSLLDGEVQELDAAGLAIWENSSAYFNGDAVKVELVAGAATAQNRIKIELVARTIIDETLLGCGFPCGICGPDDRVPSSVLFTSRLLPAGCTATLFTSTSCLVSAGHCIFGSMVIQFNVPPSNANCSTNNPPVADQFPILMVEFVNGGIGNDWSVMTSGTNNLGETAFQRYGERLPISEVPVSNGDPLTVWGYGIDNECTLSQVQQISLGFVTSVASTFFNHNVDITCGNSGSSMIRDGEIVGIVTHCPCPGWSTRMDVSAFTAAREAICPVSDGTPPVPDPMTFSTPPVPTSSNKISMIATLATDLETPPVRYQFDFVSGGAGGDDSGWRLSRQYTDDGLEVDTEYSYRVRARDSADPPNMTAYSGVFSAVTFSAVCGDGNVEGDEQCDPPDGGVNCDENCQTIPVVCGNGIVQTGEQCDPPDERSCDENCQNIIAECSTNAECDDGDTCTDNVCSGGQCSYPFNTAPCGFDICQPNALCSNGVCLTGEPLDCDDGNPCTDDTCLPAFGCQSIGREGVCDDGDVCTVNDTCVDGECIGDLVGACDDGDACTTNDTCADNQCVGTEQVDCDDGSPCTADSCDPDVGCVHENLDGACDDGSVCTTGDTCVGGVCIGDTIDCDDGEPCTDDSCDALSGCRFVNNNEPCDDDDACTVDDACAGGSCTGTPILYGDVNHDGIVDLGDILCVLDGFQGLFNDCSQGDVDIANCAPDQIIDLQDILAILDAFEGTATCCSG